MTEWKGRDPKRIARLLNLLKMEWEKRPDMRLGQIITRHTMINPLDVGEDFGAWLDGVEDDDLIHRLYTFLKVLPKTERLRREGIHLYVSTQDGQTELVFYVPVK